MRFACAYFRARWFYVEKVKDREEHRGYDLIAHRAKERVTISVKAAKCRWEIPDLTPREVTETGRLVADLLFIACPRHKAGHVLVIPRDAITPAHITNNEGNWSVRSTLANRYTLRSFLHPL